MIPNIERQRAWKARMAERGIRQYAFWLPEKRAAEVKALAKQLVENEHLEVASLRDASTGRFIRVR